MSAPTLTIGGQPVNPAAVAMPITITVGRSDPSAQPDPPLAEFTWLTDLGTHPAPQAGDPVTIDLDTGYTRQATWGDPVTRWADPAYTWDGTPLPVRRFTGVVRSVTALEAGGVTDQYEIGCVGLSARWGTLQVTATRPAETDTARVDALCAAAGVTISHAGAETVQLVAAELDGDLLSLLHSIADQAGAILWEDSHGRVWWGAADHRRGPITASLPAGDILDRISWDSDTDRVINEVTVEYGPDDARQEWTYNAEDSQAQPWGLHGVTVDTGLAELTDAGDLAATILLRRAWPWWQASDIVVHSDLIGPDVWWAVNRLTIGDGVALPVPVVPGPTPGTPAAWSVEGWMETWPTPDRQILQLAVTDRRRWGAAALRTWQEQLDGGTWADWADGSWLDQLDAINI